MIKEKEIRIALFIMLFFAIFLYELSGGLITYIAKIASVHLDDLDYIKIGSFLVSIFTVLVSFRSKLIIRLAGYSYVGGTYSGSNIEMDAKGKDLTKYEERFIIHQSLLKITINGTTGREKGEFYSIWKGDLIERKDNSYTFVLEVERYDGKSYALLNLRIDRDRAVGFIDFSSAGQVKHKEKIIAEKSKD